MKRIVLVMVVTSLFLSLFAADLTTSGDFRTRLTWYKDLGNVQSKNYFDSRAQLKFDAEIEKNLSFTYLLRSGDMVWGGVSAGQYSKAVNVKTRHAYFTLKNSLAEGTFTIGLQPWYDHRSLVLDDDMAGVFYTKEMTPDMNLQLGYVQLQEAKDYPTINGKDNQLYMANLDAKMGEQLGFGLNFLFNRYENGVGKSAHDMWFMPFATYKMGNINLDGMFAMNMGTSPKMLPGDKDVTNSGMALSLKAGMDMNEQMGFGVDFLYASGDDGTDAESKTQFKTLSSYYMNGLEYLGVGAHDGSPAGFWFDANGGIDGDNDGNIDGNLGMMSFVLNGHYGLNDKANLHGALGMVNYAEDVTNAEGKKVSDLGTEIDLGCKYQLLEKMGVDIVGAYVLTGEVYGKDADNVYELSTVFTFEF